MKNKKSFLFNLCTAILGVFTLIFLSQGYIKSTLLGTHYTSGYDCINFDSNNGKADTAAFAILAITILVSVLILIALINILKDCNAFKTGKGFGKIMALIELILTALVLGLSIVAISCIGSLISDSPISSIGWALIVNLIISAVLFLVSIFKILTIKKK